MTTIYEQHDAAFNLVSAYVILNGSGDRIATIAFKYPKDGAGRLWCYFHLIGLEMSRAYAGGYGYDKTSAAACNAIEIAKAGIEKDHLNHTLSILQSSAHNIGGKDWKDIFTDNGYVVYKAV